MEHDHFEHALVQHLHSLEHVLLTEYRQVRTMLEPCGRKDVQTFARQCSLGEVSNCASPEQVIMFPEFRARGGLESAPQNATTISLTSTSPSSWRHTPARTRRLSGRMSGRMLHDDGMHQNMYRELDADKFLLHTMIFGRPPHRRSKRILESQTLSHTSANTTSDWSSALTQASADFAHASDRWKRLEFANRAETCMSVIVLANIAIVGLSTDVWKGWGGWLIIDAVFAGIFLVELIVKMRNQGCHGFFYAHERRWNVFEVLLALLAVGEVVTLGLTADSDGGGKLSFLRILRLARVAKILRVLRMDIFAELAQMIEGALGGVKTLMWSCVMIVIPLYMLAVVLRDTLGKHASENKGAETFDSLPNALFTVFRCVVSGDCSNEKGQPIFVLLAKNYGWSYAALYSFTMIFCVFGIFNVVIAIFVEKTVAASKGNSLLQKRKRLQDYRMLATKAAEICGAIMRVVAINSVANFQLPSFLADGKEVMNYSWHDLSELALCVSNVSITRGIWDSLEEDSIFRNALFDLDISEEDQDELFQTVDADDGGSISAVELITAICKLRGDPKRSDIVGVSLMSYQIYAMLCDAQEKTAKNWAQQAKINQTSCQIVPGTQLVWL